MEDDDYFKNEEYSPFRAILGLVTFSTILPLKTYTSLEHMTKMTWLWPLVHLLIGVLAALCGFICLEIFHLDQLFTAIIVYAFLMIITGYNHIDGVMDMSDAVMVMGDKNKKIAVMKDSMVGAGGITSAILIALLTVGGIYNILDYNFILGIIIAEMVAKNSLITTALVSKPLTPGIGSYFINATNNINYIFSTVIVAIISYLIGGHIALIGLVGAILAGFIIAIVARKNFGIANGDVLGTSNEVGRVMALLFMSIALFFI